MMQTVNKDLPEIDKYKVFWRRLAAMLLDELIFLPLSYVATYFENGNNKLLFIVWSVFHTLAYASYFIWLHGKYGQTIGKKLMNIKIVTLDERSVIGLIPALKREAVWIITAVVGLIYSSINVFHENLDDFVGTMTLIWAALEMITMLFNAKRRAIHDFIAGSVVIKD